MKPFAHLPDLCLLALFKQLPLNDQLEAQRVSFRWSQLVVEVTRARRQLNILGNWDIRSYEVRVNKFVTGVAVNQKMAKLLVKADGTPLHIFSRLTAWNSLKYEHLSEEIVRQISSTFTGVKGLQVAIAFNPVEQFDHLVLLLTHWRDQLVALKLHECSYLEEVASAAAATRLLTAINSLSALKHLKLNFGNLPVHDLPIVSQLEKLHLASDRTPQEVFVSILKRHAQANAALQIEYQNVQCDDIHSFTTLSEQLRHAFTQLKVRTSLINQLHWLERICTNFPSLQYLDCALSSATLRHLFGHLSKLHQLVYLQLHINFSTIQHDDQAHLPLLQLPSVKGLELHITMSTHKDLEQLKLHWTMPNLQAIELGFCISSKCTDCDINYHYINYFIILHEEIFKTCFRHLFSQLKLTCSQLRSIRYNLEYICGTVEELLAEV